jgi:hypothetical protein
MRIIMEMMNMIGNEPLIGCISREKKPLKNIAINNNQTIPS